MTQPKTVSVLPNPYAALDHLGRPAGVVLVEPKEYADNEAHPKPSLRYAPRYYVGATLKATPVRKASRLGKLEANDAVHDRTWTFSSEPVKVAPSLYYREHVMTGDLVAADVESWMALGGSRDTFVEPAKLLAARKAHAIAHHAKEHGKDAVHDDTHTHWAEFLDPHKVAIDLTHVEVGKAKAPKRLTPEEIEALKKAEEAAAAKAEADVHVAIEPAQPHADAPAAPAHEEN